MNRSNIIKSLVFLLVVCLLTSFTFLANSQAQNFRLVTDVLDGFGGRASSANFLERISTGGQPSVVGKMGSTNFEDRSGYTHCAWVWHGDADGNGNMDLSDVITIANVYFGKPGFELRPYEAGDVNCDNIANLGDAIYLANYKLKGGSPPCNL
ncbi:MAG: hypothetical protein AMJ90_03715 [candidate division Zixibacteria bacterium SM23_73_2]|nr:MAG: hypothetical protein AMJ90_03715 [candidate division Zixibacteria bacterium SM23_73_2]